MNQISLVADVFRFFVAICAVVMALVRMNKKNAIDIESMIAICVASILSKLL